MFILKRLSELERKVGTNDKKVLCYQYFRCQHLGFEWPTILTVGLMPKPPAFRNGWLLSRLGGLVDSLDFVPNSGKFPPPGAQILQPGSFRARIAASFTTVPVAGSPLEGHLGIQDDKFSVCHTATMPEWMLGRNPVRWSGFYSAQGLCGEKISAFGEFHSVLHVKSQPTKC